MNDDAAAAKPILKATHHRLLRVSSVASTKFRIVSFSGHLWIVVGARY